MWWMLVVACGGPAASAPSAERGASAGKGSEAAVVEVGPTDEERLARAEAAAKKLGGALKGRLMAAMADGPLAAATVCAQEAGAIRESVRAETGVDVGRASLRMRSQAQPTPAWVSAWLTAQGERPAEGAQGVAELVVEGGTKVARRLIPIAVEPPCLVCHGPRETLAPEIADLLAKRYPTDAATGYAVGDLRGALWAEAR